MHKVRMLGVVLVCALCAGRAHADTVYSDWHTIAPQLIMDIHRPSDTSYLNNIRTGLNVWKVKADSPPTNVTTSPYFEVGQVFKAFCIEVVQGLVDPTLFNVVELEDAPDNGTSSTAMGELKANRIKELWARYYQTDSNPFDNVTAAAFQLSVWNIGYDDDDLVDGGKGAFYAKYSADSSGTDKQKAVYQANQWLATLGNDLSEYDGSRPLADLKGLVNTHKQDMVTVVPTPSAAGIGLIAFGMAAMRRRRKPVAA